MRKMQIWKWLILSVAFVVNSSCCNALSLPQKNQTEHLASESPLANVNVYQQGHFENSSRAQGLRRNTPEFSAPLDPLSRSFMKVKKDKRRQRKMPQKQPGQKNEQIMSGESSNFQVIRVGDTVQLADNVERTPMQQPNTKPNGHTDILAFERNPTHYVRTKIPKRGASLEHLAYHLIALDTYHNEEAKTERSLYFLFNTFLLDVKRFLNVGK